MTKKGFTLVELLTIIIILSLLIAIAVPSALAISKKIKEKMLDTKLNLASKSAILWGQDNKSCFTSVDSSCPSSLSCSNNGNNKECTITLGYLATENYLEYDRDDNTIENPVDKTTMNNCRIRIIYNTLTKTFNAEPDDPLC